MLPVLSDPDSLVILASHLLPPEAGMLRGLLESAGIAAVLRDDVLSGIHPFLQPAIGGVKLAVRASDAERAQEIIWSAGVLPGPGPEEPVDIPEEEWSRTPDAEPVVGLEASPPAWPRRVVMAAPFLFALLLALWRCGVGS